MQYIKILNRKLIDDIIILMKKYESFNDLVNLKEAFDRGDVIAFPTDTVFGLAVIYDDKEAIEKLKRIKNRDAHKPLPMMCSSIDMMEEVADLSMDARKIAKHFFPGALTMILNKKKHIPDYVTNGFKTIGIRIPNYEGILKLIDYIGKPLLVTSANISGQKSLKRYEDVINELPDIDGIICIDAFSDTASTIVDMTEDIKVLRQGKIAIEDILKLLKEKKECKNLYI